MLLYTSSDHQQSIRRLGELKKQAESGTDPEAAFSLACAYTGMHVYDEALKWLEISYERKENAFLDVLAEPLLQPLRWDTKFASFIA